MTKLISKSKNKNSIKNKGLSDTQKIAIEGVFNTILGTTPLTATILPTTKLITKTSKPITYTIDNNKKSNSFDIEAFKQKMDSIHNGLL